MRTQKITHNDGSTSYATEGISIVKNKEDVKKQKIEIVEDKNNKGKKNKPNKR